MTGGNPAQRRSKSTQDYQTHGLTAAMKAGRGYDPKALDGRTSLAKELAAAFQESVIALGGASGVSPKRKPSSS